MKKCFRASVSELYLKTLLELVHGGDVELLPGHAAPELLRAQALHAVLLHRQALRGLVPAGGRGGGLVVLSKCV